MSASAGRTCVRRSAGAGVARRRRHPRIIERAHAACSHPHPITLLSPLPHSPRGSKRWFLRPPTEAEYSTVPASRFVPLLARNGSSSGSGSGSGSLLECTQRGGDVLYVPYTWSHATVNLRTSVGYAVEFDTPLWATY